MDYDASKNAQRAARPTENVKDSMYKEYEESAWSRPGLLTL
jgi:hypothetical protein